MNCIHTGCSTSFLVNGLKTHDQKEDQLHLYRNWCFFSFPSFYEELARIKLWITRKSQTPECVQDVVAAYPALIYQTPFVSLHHKSNIFLPKLGKFMEDYVGMPISKENLLFIKIRLGYLPCISWQCPIKESQKVNTMQHLMLYAPQK